VRSFFAFAFGPPYYRRPNGSASEIKIEAAFIFTRWNFVNAQHFHSSDDFSEPLRHVECSRGYTASTFTTQLNFDLMPVSAAQASAEQKKGKHVVWVPSNTGSHIGGRWVEVDDSAKTDPGALNVQRANAEQLQRQAQCMGGASSGR
jgi:hypothetical protein